MPTLNEIKTEVATYFQVAPGDLTINGQDLFLIAINQARRKAEMAHDFEFNRQLLTLTVDGVTGGTLTNAVLYGTVTTALIKTIVDLGTLDENNNFLPQFWQSASSSLEKQRQDNPNTFFRYPTDGQIQASPAGGPRLILRNDKIFRWPADVEPSNDYNVAIEAYILQPDWLGVISTATVAGTTTPDVEGAYTAVGTFNGKTLFMDDDDNFIYYDTATSKWRIQFTLAPDNYTIDGGFSLSSTSESPVGSYTAETGATGTPAVTVASLTDVWTTYGHEYLLWQTISILNHRFKEFVPRTEGNLQPPYALAQSALEALIEWDEGKFSRYQRSSR